MSEADAVARVVGFLLGDGGTVALLAYLVWSVIDLRKALAVIQTDLSWVMRGLQKMGHSDAD